jgi:acyl dehydratase
MMFDSLEALLAFGAGPLGTTAWHKITQRDVEYFAEATNAREWIHVDVDRARQEGPFGSTVAHGYLTMSLATPFVTELLQVGGPVVGVNYGLNRVRFPAPVPVGRRIRARGLLKGVERRQGGAQTLIELSYETEGTERPPCIAEVLTLVLPTGR